MQCRTSVGKTVDGLATLLFTDMDGDNAAAYRVDVVNKALVRRRRGPNFRPSMG